MRTRLKTMLRGTAALSFGLLAATVATAQTQSTTPTPDQAGTASSPVAVPTPEQGEQPAQGQAGDGGDIVVTGTLIRGTAPTGTNVVAVSKDAIVASGATTANDILATIPQVTTNFNRVRSLPAGASGITNLTPSIRNIGASGATTTLILVDGHRIPNAGVLSTSPDPDVIPPGVIDRVEVVPDGGSSIYGSDAVGGVINFITRKRFSGFEATGRLGIARDYTSVESNITAGSDWQSGSGYVSYAFLHHDEIFGRDRDYLRQVTPNAGQCGAGTVFVGNTSYALPNRTPGTITDCDNTDAATLYPRETRHSIFGGLTQEVGTGITFDVKAFYTRREVLGRSDPADNNSGGAGVTQVICSPTVAAATCSAAGGVRFPGYVAVAGDTGVQRVAFNYGGVINTRQENNLDEWQITPSLTAKLGGGWQLRLLGSVGESSTDFFQQQPDSGSQATAVAAGTLNPYSPTTTSASTLATVFRNFIGTGTQKQTNARAIVDGGLFSLPGGDVRLAVGAEYLRESLDNVVFSQFVPGTEQNATPKNGSRHIESVFGELVVPVVGAGNEMSVIRRLTLSASGRYDHYSDFGGTFNPKVGLTFEPFRGVSFRGNYGKSFNAPSLADTNAPDTRSFSLPAFLALAPGVPQATASQQLVVLVGGNPNLGPQRAKTWSAGVDIDVPFIQGLKLSATYYDIRLKDQIAFNTQFYTPASAGFYILAPTRAQVEAALANSQPYLGTPLDTLYSAGFGGVYSLLDFRRNNLARVNQNGVDFNLTYLRDTGFGSINAGLAGTYTIHRNVSTSSTGTFTDALKNPGDTDLLLAGSLGATAGAAKASITLNHTQGYDLGTPLTTARFGTQTRVKSFNTVDLFAQFDIRNAQGATNFSVTLNVENALDQDPPFYNGTSGVGGSTGFTNGSTLGRVVLMGVRKQF